MGENIFSGGGKVFPPGAGVRLWEETYFLRWGETFSLPVRAYFEEQLFLRDFLRWGGKLFLRDMSGG